MYARVEPMGRRQGFRSDKNSQRSVFNVGERLAYTQLAINERRAFSSTKRKFSESDVFRQIFCTFRSNTVAQIIFYGNFNCIEATGVCAAAMKDTEVHQASNVWPKRPTKI